MTVAEFQADIEALNPPQVSRFNTMSTTGFIVADHANPKVDLDVDALAEAFDGASNEWFTELGEYQQENASEVLTGGRPGTRQGNPQNER